MEISAGFMQFVGHETCQRDGWEKCVKFVAQRLHTQTREVVPSVNELLRCGRESSLEEIL